MADTYTLSLRITQPQVGADTNTWGTLLNTDWSLVEAAITGHTSVTLTGATHTLTSNNGSADEARNQIIEFVGSPGVTCTVTMPAVAKLGMFVNSTANNVILTAGGGTTVTVPPDGFWYWTYCDGTNVTGVSIATANRVTSPEFKIDTNYYIKLDSSNPLINLDSNDFITYDRSGNRFVFAIGLVDKFSVTTDRATSAVALNIPSDPPASPTDSGQAGDMTWDADYFYICTFANTWKRVAISTWVVPPG